MLDVKSVTEKLTEHVQLANDGKPLLRNETKFVGNISKHDFPLENRWREANLYRFLID
jgi:hypothetical protein